MPSPVKTHTLQRFSKAKTRLVRRLAKARIFCVYHNLNQRQALVIILVSMLLLLGLLVTLIATATAIAMITSRWADNHNQASFRSDLKYLMKLFSPNQLSEKENQIIDQLEQQFSK